MRTYYRPLYGKCKEYIEKEKCLGCNRLENPMFTGDDNCSWIRECENRKEKKDWKIEGIKETKGEEIKLW